MGLFRKAAVAGIAKKVYTEARKPHNQAKIKRVVANVRGRRAGNPAPGASRGTPPSDPGGSTTAKRPG